MIQKINEFKRSTGESRISTVGARWQWCSLPESVCGYYNERNDIVYINQSFKHAGDDYIFGLLCHELHHRWQRETWGAFRYAAEKIIRFRMERTADEIERAASAWIGVGGLENR